MVKAKLIEWNRICIRSLLKIYCGGIYLGPRVIYVIEWVENKEALGYLYIYLSIYLSIYSEKEKLLDIAKI